MIYYLSPKNDQPVGGILVLARHVELLGNRATFVAEEPFDLWWAVPKPVLQQTTMDELAVGPEDTIVVPECRWQWLADYPAKRRILFVQNMAYFEEVGSATEIMVCGLFLHTVMKRKCELPIHLVYPFWYDQPWRGDIDMQRPYKLIFVDRRGSREHIDYLIEKLDDEVGLDECFVVSGLTQDELAEKLRQSCIYVHLSYPEGFPAPVIEAWLCGAGAVGYAGGGGLEFMLHGHNALVAPDGDVDSVLEYIRILLCGIWSGLAREGRRTALRYNQYLALKQLGDVFPDD